MRIHSGTFTELVEIVRKREQDLGRSALETSCNNKRTWRVKFGDDEKVSDDKEEPRQSKKKKKKNGETPKGKYAYIPFMPKFVFATFNSDAKTNFSKWRQLTNQGETTEKKHLVDTSSDDVDTGTEKPLKKTVKKKG